MVKPRQLVKDVFGKRRTDVQRKQSWREKYDGQRISWLACVKEINELENCIIAWLRLPSLGSNSRAKVAASAPFSRLQQFAQFSEGSYVIVSGELQSYGELSTMNVIFVRDASLERATISQRLTAWFNGT